MKKKPDSKKLGKLGGALRHWYFVVGVEMEAIVQAHYPAAAADSLHDVVHQVLDPIDRHRFPRIVCNLIAEATWPEPATLSALAKLKPKPIKPWRETTLATLPNVKTTLKRTKSVLP